MKDVIKKDVSSALSTVQKTRHSIAAQHFIKGAENYLMNFNNEIQGIVDVEKMKEQHSKIIDQKTQEVDQKNKDLQEAQKQGNKLLLSAVLVAGSLAFLYPRIKASFSKSVKSVKDNQLVASLLQHTSPSDAFSKAIKFMGGYGEFVLKSINILAGNLYIHAIQPLMDVFLDFFDFFLFGQNYTVSYDKKENVFMYLIDECGNKIFEIINEKTGIIDTLKFFLGSTGKKIVEKPKLVAYLKYAKEQRDKIIQGVETTGTVTQEYEEIQKTGFFTVSYESVSVDNRELWKTGGDTPETNDKGWQRLRETYGQINKLIYDNLGEAFVGQYKTGRPHSFQWQAVGLQTAIYNPAPETYLTGVGPNSSPLYAGISWNLMQILNKEIQKDTTIQQSSDILSWRYYGTEHDQLLRQTKEELDSIPFYMTHTKMYKGLITWYNTLSEIKNGWGVIDMINNVNLNIISIIYAQQYTMSTNEMYRWTRHSEEGVGFVGIYKDKLQTFIKNYRIKTLVQQLDEDMYKSNLSFEMYTSRLHDIFSAWGRGEEMFPKTKRINMLYKVLDYIKIETIMQHINRQLINAAVSIALYNDGDKHQKLSIKNYNKNVGFGQNDNPQRDVIFKSDEGKNLKKLCVQIVTNVLELRELQKNVRKNRNTLLQATNAIVAKLTQGSRAKDKKAYIAARKAKRQMLVKAIETLESLSNEYAGEAFDKKLKEQKEWDKNWMASDPSVRQPIYDAEKAKIDAIVESVNN